MVLIWGSLGCKGEGVVERQGVSALPVDITELVFSLPGLQSDGDVESSAGGDGATDA